MSALIAPPSGLRLNDGIVISEKATSKGDLDMTGSTTDRMQSSGGKRLEGVLRIRIRSYSKQLDRKPASVQELIRFRIVGIALLGLMFTACGQQKESSISSLVSAASERLGLDVCYREGIGEPVLCGSISVPADRANMGGSTTEVRFIVIPANNGNPENLAWTEHQGGPGRTVLPIASLFASGGALEHFRERRDVLLFDQRGVGESQGVHCEALATPRVLSPYFSPESVKACRDEIEARGLLSIDYSTIAAVDDLEAIRERLGYKQLDVGGWSYGSKFMLTYAHRYPERVRTISVFVPTPIDYQRPVDWARFTEAALNRMFDDCASQPACASAYPDLRDEWEKLLEVVEHDPPTLRYTNPYTNQVESVQLTKARLIDEVHVALIRVSRVRGLPHIIHQAAFGDFAPFMEFAVPSDSDFTPLAEATYLSIVCAEETAFIDVETAEELSQGTFAGLHFVDEFRLACEILGKPPHPAYPLETQVSDTPILIVAGGRDPITPIEYGERIAEGFLNATLVRIEHMPHHTTGLPGSAECFDRILFELIEAGSMEGINTACASELKMAAFETGS